MSVIGLNGLLLHPPFSGVETAINQLAEALARHGTEEYVFFVPHRYPDHNMDAGRFRTYRVPLTVPGRVGRLLWEQLRLPDVLKHVGADLLHAPGYLAPLRCAAPTVLTVYDLIALQHPHWCRFTNRLNYRFFLPKSIRNASRIIVPSNATRREVCDRFPEVASRVRVVPLAVHEDFRPVTKTAKLNAVSARYELPNRFVLFVGNMEPKKNIPRLLLAWHRIRKAVQPCKLILTGAVAWDWTTIRRRILELGLGREVFHTHYVDFVDLPALYTLADAFVFPSLYEGFGLPPLEAMACGTPVVTTTSGALPETTGGAALTVDPLDIDALSQAIMDVLQNQDLREKLVSKGHQRARHFSWQRTSQATESVYREVLQSTTT